MNKKISLMILICFIALGNCFAIIQGSRFKITESEKEFDVLYFLTEDMKVIDNKQNEDGLYGTSSFAIQYG